MVDYRIRTFLVLYETMNYRKTGEQLCLSQPAVSQQIRGLEEKYGCKLFVYDGRRLHATPQAHRVAEYARTALYNEQRLVQELAGPSAREIRVGATKTIGEFVVAEALSRYIRQSGDSLTITVDNTSALLGQLEHEQLDFALIEGAFDRDKFGSRLFRRARFVGLCRRDHPFAGRTVSLEALAGQCLVVREEGSGTRGILEHALAERGYSLQLFSRVICANQFSLITRFVAEGAGVTFAYEPVAAGQPELAFFHLDCLDEHREFSLVYLKGTHVFPLVQEVLGPLAPSGLEDGAE
ncbi:LysR family transcriptional regulator [uncultured Flavonifractor sp.]|uniref:LysR family transcriptional regulator n=1 Tax=uncultured Flavonifractor sp. TaxID=1193534 RepID=UPI002616E3C4|nr:LysR family transcriptional regulator [uncultured Flavonifractor sp.]